MTIAARRLLVAGALLMALATIIGAFAAHALKARLSADRYEVLQTAVQYQFFQALGLLAIGLVADRYPSRVTNIAGALVFAGTLLFSGSLYLMLAGVPKFVGFITPMGGLCLIAGWLCAVYAMSGRKPGR